MTSTIQTGSYKGYIISGAQLQQQELLAERQELLAKLKQCQQKDNYLSERLIAITDSENGMVGRSELSQEPIGLVAGGNYYNV